MFLTLQETKVATLDIKSDHFEQEQDIDSLCFEVLSEFESIRLRSSVSVNNRMWRMFIVMFSQLGVTEPFCKE